MSEKTPYEAIGGRDIVHAAVDLFYENLLGDTTTAPPVSRHFAGLSTGRFETVRERTSAVISRMLGAPDVPPVDLVRLARAHERLDITPQDFDVTVNHLVHAFAELPQGKIAVAALGKYVQPLHQILVTPPQEGAL